MYDGSAENAPSGNTATVSGRNNRDKSVGEILKKTKTRIHDVLTLYPCSSLGSLHTAVRPYNADWRVVFEKMVSDGEVRREAVEFKGRVHYRHYTNHPSGQIISIPR